MKTTQKNYINGLKGFACIMVMLGHFIGIYKYAENFPASSKILQLFDSFYGSKLSFIIDETFWVILFFLVSGYLVSMSKVPDFKSFLYKSVTRFLRLGLPILFACLIIFITQKTFGFYTAETKDIFENSFIQKCYISDFSLWQVLKSPVDVLLFGNIGLCSPYWVLREMFASSVLIYFMTWLKDKINVNLFVVLWIASLVISMAFSNIIFAGLFGMTVNIIQNDKDKKFCKNKIALVFVLAFCMSLYFIPRTRIASVFFGALILIVPEIKFVNSVFSSRIAQFINKISFGIYSFHWPVFCSVGMFTLLKTHSESGLLISALLSIIVSTVATLLISTVYHYAIEKHIYKCLNILNDWWRKKHA